MKVIILCGGMGTRMKEETEFKPKPMVQVGGMPLIWHIMKIYSSYGFNEFILALGYKSEYIKEFFLNQKAFANDFTLDMSNHEIEYHFNESRINDNFKITFIDTGLTTKIGGRVLQCKKYIPKEDSDFMLTYGDCVSDINIKKLLKYHNTKGKLATITGAHLNSKYGSIKADSSGLVKSFIEKPFLKNWANGGFMILKRSAFKYFKSDEMEHPALTRFIKQKQLAIYRHNKFLFFVDTIKELETLNAIWATNNPPWKVW